MTKGNFWALLPIGIFLILFLGSGILIGDFYVMSALLCFLVALAVAMLQNKKRSFSEKLSTFSKGVGEKNIITMILIFLCAGMFSGAVGSIGGVASTVQFGLSIIPAELAVVGVFVISCFVSTAMGTSVGTITAIAPIGYGVAMATGINEALCLAAVVSGAMFGDNLSMVSDTTIAAVGTQGCQMRDKFKRNFFIVLPAAIISCVVFYFATVGQVSEVPVGDYNVWKIVPYLFVLISAIAGLNVFMVLSGGTVLSLVIGLFLGEESITMISMLKGVGTGITSMYDIALISLVVAGVVEIIKANGGIDAIIYLIRKSVKGKRGAQAGIAVLVTLVDFFTANNTVAIVIAGPIAKDIANEFDVDPRTSASLLDIFGSFAQGVIPYGAQLLAAGSFAYAGAQVAISPLEIMPFLFYPYLMAISALVYIFFISGRKFGKNKKDKQPAEKVEEKQEQQDEVVA